MNRPSSFAWRPATTMVLLGGFVVILIGLVVSYAITTFKPTTEVRINAAVYHLQLASTEEELEQGLSGVDELPPNGGLLMDFGSDGTWGIWMKDMLIPLDIVWLDKDKEVVYIQKEVSPELGTSEIMRPKVPSRYVLELPSGNVSKAAIKIGQQADFTIKEGTE